jgi:Xaa-Pro dipeptidase
MGASTLLRAVDFERLRRDRLSRCFDAMERGGVDVLVLGREANVRYVTDARRLWLAGPRPFGPGCIVVAATREVHLLSTSDDGVPSAIPARRLYPLTWNPDVLSARLARIDGLCAARRIGVDGWNAAAGRLLAALAPEARLVDGATLLAAARRRKTDGEVACLRAALAIAAEGIEAVARTLRPGADEAVLRGVFAERAAALGATISSLEGRFRVAFGARGAEPPQAAGGREKSFAPADHVLLRAGVLLAGYEGTLAWTQACAPSAAPATRLLAERTQRLFEALAVACRAGASAADLLDAYRRCGEELPQGAIARGVGLGSEPPLVGAEHACDTAARFEVGMVLSLRASIASAGAVAYEIEAPVLVGEDGGEKLVSTPSESSRGGPR